MNCLYPSLEPFDSFRLQVSDQHNLYIEQVGNPNGIPVLFVHGGPGGGIIADYRRFFDPKKYRVILFDQRGAGKSTPHAELNENTTWHLIDDIEKIRMKLPIEQWHIFGGSWGSTLSLLYGIQHPDRVLSFILRGIFLCRPHEIHWFYQQGCSEIFPDEWDKYLKLIPESERDNLVQAYYKRLTSQNLEERLSAAKAWSHWEGATSYLVQNKKTIDKFELDEFALAFARIECHYFINKIFLGSDNYILENIEKIKHIRSHIVQGRYDVVCPSRSAWELHKNWPNSNLHIIADAGHSAFETGITTRLVTIMDQL